MSVKPPAGSVWTLPCVWCDWYVIVNGRGMRGADPGSGVEAADVMREHVERVHDETWERYTRELRSRDKAVGR